MLSKKYIGVVSIMVIIGVGIVCILCHLNSRSRDSKSDNIQETKIEWYDYDPFDFSIEDIVSITYIMDRSKIGEETNLCYYIEEQSDIQAIMECIDNDISFKGYFDNATEIPAGDYFIVLWITLSDGTSHKIEHSSTRFSYGDATYEIEVLNDVLANASWKILKGYEATEISGINNPYE
ncbi:MAG: hypothetical protein E7255_12620 [Lachnospiraceae bacterium]|jgi:hypothetical protein|nr:hypothetical protein [Lachnospiraceae bacterium]